MVASFITKIYCQTLTTEVTENILNVEAYCIYVPLPSVPSYCMCFFCFCIILILYLSLLSACLSLPIFSQCTLWFHDALLLFHITFDTSHKELLHIDSAFIFTLHESTGRMRPAATVVHSLFPVKILTERTGNRAFNTRDPVWNAAME